MGLRRNNQCQHGNVVKKCGKCKAAVRKIKNDAKRAKRQARQDKKKINQIKNAAKDMKTPWRADGTSRSGNRDAKGRNVNGIRYDDNGKRIWKDD